MGTKTPYELRQAVDQTMSDGYGEAAAPASRRDRNEKLAAGFRPNERQEALIRLRDRDPAAFAALPPATRMGAATYEAAKAAAESGGG